MSRAGKLYWAGAALVAIGVGGFIFAATRGTSEPPEQGAAKLTAPSFPATLRPPRTTAGSIPTGPTATSSTSTSAPPATPQTTRNVTGPCNVKHEGTGPLEQFLGAGHEGALAGSRDYQAAGGKPRPPAWQPQPQQGFDWTGSGAATGKLVIDSANQTVMVDWGAGRISVTGVRAGIDIRGNHADTTPAAVADVTGDGRLDLIVFEDDTVAVVTGQGAQTPSRVAAFEEIGRLPTEWVSPPRRLPLGRSGSAVDQVPRGKLSRTVVPLWDITGDGINDFSVDAPRLGRGSGSSLYYAGQPCQGT